MNKIKHCFLIFVALAAVIVAKAQSGYLGSTNAVELRTYIAPSYRNVLKLTDDGTVQKKRLRLAHVSYELNYARVMSRHIELSLGYKFANMSAFTLGSKIQTVSSNGSSIILRDFLEEPKIKSHGFAFQFKYYRKGSLAPIGKFIGLNLTYQTAALKKGKELYYGQLGGGSTESSSFLGSSRGVENVDTLSLLRTQRINSFHLKGVVGRNYPLTDKIMLSVSATLPLISFYSGGVFNAFGLRIGGSTVKQTDSDGLTAITLKKYNRISFEVGVRYQL